MIHAFLKILLIFYLIVPSSAQLDGSSFDGFKESISIDPSTWFVADDGGGVVYLAQFTNKNMNDVNLYPVPFDPEVSKYIVAPDGLGIDVINKILYISDATTNYLIRVLLNEPLSVNGYVNASATILQYVGAPKKMLVDPSGKFLYLADQQKGCIFIVTNLDIFPNIKTYYLTAEGSLNAPHGMTFLQMPLSDPYAQYNIGSKSGGARALRTDVIFVADKNWITYVNASSSILRNLALNNQKSFNVPDGTYDISIYFTTSKVDVMAIWFESNGTQLLCVSKSETCKFFVLEANPSFVYFNSNKQMIINPQSNVNIQNNNEITCPIDHVISNHPHGMNCDLSGDTCIVSDPGRSDQGNLAKLSYQTIQNQPQINDDMKKDNNNDDDDVISISSIIFTNYSKFETTQVWLKIIKNVEWDSVTMLRYVDSNMFDKDLSFSLLSLPILQLFGVLLLFVILSFIIYKSIYYFKHSSSNNDDKEIKKNNKKLKKEGGYQNINEDEEEAEKEENGVN